MVGSTLRAMNRRVLQVLIAILGLAVAAAVAVAGSLANGYIDLSPLSLPWR